MALLLDHLKTFFLTQRTDRKYWIGFSGGLDSLVLLHLCVSLRQQLPLQLCAVHVNHGLSPYAPDWVKYCAQRCHEWQVDFIQKNINAKAAVGDSPENTARQYRYALFAELLAFHDVLLTAHHQDDQAETVLIQLLRGAGPKGLSAMPLLKPFARGMHGRPLLSISRAELRKYAEEYHLRWIEDESNADTDFTRNFIRHNIMPALKQRWPTVTRTLTRTADHCAEAQALLESMAMQDLVLCRGNAPGTLSVQRLLSLDTMRQRQVLRAWLVELNLLLPSASKLYEIQEAFLHAASDQSPYMKWGGVELRRYRDELYVMPCLPAHDSRQCSIWDFQQPLVLSIGTLEAVFTEGSGLKTDIRKVMIRFRQGGEHCQLPGRQCHHALKHLFQQWGVPPWERERVPLIYWEDILIGVAGYFMDERYTAKGNEMGYQIKIVLKLSCQRKLA
jgi:tRNA(Ile)-lysidine synthase